MRSEHAPESSSTGRPRHAGARSRFPAATLAGLAALLALATPSTAQEPQGQAQENPCLQCHEQIGSRTAVWKGRRFPHGRHIEDAKLECSFCHTPLQEHGGITLESVTACDNCHHVLTSSSSCSRCHEGAAGAPKGILALPKGDFDHAHHVAAGVPCASCHKGRTMSAKGLACENCHSSHHRPEADCLACHRPGSVPEHPKEAHTMCAACHGEKAAFLTRWTRTECLVCHTDRADHYPEGNCAVCHIVPPPEGATGSGASN
jgi:hypothetical protein